MSGHQAYHQALAREVAAYAPRIRAKNMLTEPHRCHLANAKTKMGRQPVLKDPEEAEDAAPVALSQIATRHLYQKHPGQPRKEHPESWAGAKKKPG